MGGSGRLEAETGWPGPQAAGQLAVGDDLAAHRVDAEQRAAVRRARLEGHEHAAARQGVQIAELPGDLPGRLAQGRLPRLAPALGRGGIDPAVAVELDVAQHARLGVRGRPSCAPLPRW